MSKFSLSVISAAILLGTNFVPLGGALDFDAGPVFGPVSAHALTANQNQKQDKGSFDFEHVSCRGEDQEIRVIVTKVKKSIGLIVVDLYAEDTPAFLKKAGRITQLSFAAKSPETHFCLNAPSEGNFSVAVYHDENADFKLNKGAFGIPAEPYGMSQNPKIRFSAPPLEKTLFSVPQSGANIKIKLRN